MNPTPILAITTGEPAGIGPDICISLAQRTLPCRCVLIGDIDLLRQRAQMLGQNILCQNFDPHHPAPQGALEVWHVPLAVPCQIGQPDPRNAHYVLSLLDVAHNGIQAQTFAGMVTAPLHKGVINDAGIPFTGHTEYLAERSHTPQVVMMLAGGGLRVALATTHLPLKDVATALSPDLLHSVLTILHHDLQHKFGLVQPRILVSGLNPHAGEQGHMGREEIDIIEPVIRALQAQGMAISGPHPADTVFQPFMLEQGDAVLAMYHDQGLPVLKYASFGQGVNITLGLPFIRTSVDHGTALSLAGSGQANPDSLHAAIACAYELCQNSRKA